MKNTLFSLLFLVSIVVASCSKDSIPIISSPENSADVSPGRLKATSPAILMGTGTEWYHWRGELSINGVYTIRNLYQILRDSRIPTRLEKTYIVNAPDVAHFQDLLNNGISPVLLENNPAQEAYAAVYPTGNAWDASHKWNASVKAKFDTYLTNVVAPWIAKMKILNFNNTNLYYVINPEFTFVGDTKTSTGYRDEIIKQVDMIRAANLPNLKIVLGFLVVPSDFNSYLPTIKTYASINASLLSKVDYFGPEFHNQMNINSTVAANMINFLTTVKSYTGKANFIPNSYIYWSTTYTGTDTGNPTTPTGSDADAASFWNYLHSHRDQLINNAGLVAWCLSATLEKRGGSGLVGGNGLAQGQERPVNKGFVYPFLQNKIYNQGGMAFANWMRDEAPYTIVNKSSGKTLLGITQWVLIEYSEGYCKFKHKSSDLILGTVNNLTVDGSIVDRVADANQWCANWLLEDQGNGYYKIRNRKSGKLLTYEANGTFDILTDKGTDYQLWKLTY